MPVCVLPSKRVMAEVSVLLSLALSFAALSPRSVYVCGRTLLSADARWYNVDPDKLEALLDFVWVMQSPA
jgi:hypothetical protein